MYPRPRARERLAEAGGGRADAGHRRVEGDHPKKTPPSERRGTVQVLVHRGLSQRETRRYRGLSLTRSFDARFWLWATGRCWPIEELGNLASEWNEMRKGHGLWP